MGPCFRRDDAIVERWIATDSILNSASSFASRSFAFSPPVSREVWSARWTEQVFNRLSGKSPLIGLDNFRIRRAGEQIGFCNSVVSRRLLPRAQGRECRPNQARCRNGSDLFSTGRVAWHDGLPVQGSRAGLSQRILGRRGLLHGAGILPSSGIPGLWRRGAAGDRDRHQDTQPRGLDPGERGRGERPLTRLRFAIWCGRIAVRRISDEAARPQLGRALQESLISSS
jgi:hypothetical protein